MFDSPWDHSLTKAAKRDAELHRLLCLVDAIRGGRARERQIGGKELAKRLGNGPLEVAWPMSLVSIPTSKGCFRYAYIPGKLLALGENPGKIGAIALRLIPRCA